MIKRTTTGFDGRGVPRDIMPIVDGGLSLEWRSPTLELGLNVCPEGGWRSLLVEWIGAERRSVEGYDLSDEEALALIARVITTRGPDDA